MHADNIHLLQFTIQPNMVNALNDNANGMGGWKHFTPRRLYVQALDRVNGHAYIYRPISYAQIRYHLKQGHYSSVDVFTHRFSVTISALGTKYSRQIAYGLWYKRLHRGTNAICGVTCLFSVYLCKHQLMEVGNVLGLRTSSALHNIHLLMHRTYVHIPLLTNIIHT